MDKIQTKWKQNANETQSGRKFRHYAAGKYRKNSLFARYERIGRKLQEKKQQPNSLDYCLVLRIHLKTIPYIPDTGNHKWRLSVCGI